MDLAPHGEVPSLLVCCSRARHSRYGLHHAWQYIFPRSSTDKSPGECGKITLHTLLRFKAYNDCTNEMPHLGYMSCFIDVICCFKIIATIDRLYIFTHSPSLFSGNLRTHLSAGICFVGSRSIFWQHGRGCSLVNEEYPFIDLGMAS